MMLSLQLVCVTLIVVSLNTVTCQECGKETQDRMLQCAVELSSLSSGNAVDEVKCRGIHLAIKCMKNISEECQSSSTSNSLFHSLIDETPMLIDLVNTECGELNPCDYGEELLSDCIDQAVEGLAEKGTQKQMCKSVDGQLSCVENVVTLCRDVVSPIQKLEMIQRRHKFMKLCGRYFRGRN